MDIWTDQDYSPVDTFADAGIDDAAAEACRISSRFFQHVVIHSPTSGSSQSLRGGENAPEAWGASDSNCGNWAQLRYGRQGTRTPSMHCPTLVLDRRS